jgi:hypothetical protein
MRCAGISLGKIAMASLNPHVSQVSPVGLVFFVPTVAQQRLCKRWDLIDVKRETWVTRTDKLDKDGVKNVEWRQARESHQEWDLHPFCAPFKTARSSTIPPSEEHVFPQPCSPNIPSTFVKEFATWSETRQANNNHLLSTISFDQNCDQKLRARLFD